MPSQPLRLYQGDQDGGGGGGNQTWKWAASDDGNYELLKHQTMHTIREIS